MLTNKNTQTLVLSYCYLSLCQISKIDISGEIRTNCCRLEQTNTEKKTLWNHSAVSLSGRADLIHLYCRGVGCVS